MIALPTENEWYKAAYYDATSTSYFDYPAGSNTQTTCASPTATPNSANCGNAVLDFTPRGSYPGSPSPYGTFDQGGNAWECQETIRAGVGRSVRGGSFYYGDAFSLRANWVSSNAPAESFIRWASAW